MKNKARSNGRKPPENLGMFFSDPLYGCTKEMFESLTPKVQKEKFKEWVILTYGTEAEYEELPIIKVETQEDLENYLNEL